MVRKACLAENFFLTIFFFTDTIWFIAIIVMDFLEPPLTKDRLADVFHSNESAFYFIIHHKNQNKSPWGFVCEMVRKPKTYYA